MRILGKRDIPEHISREAKEAGFGQSDFYVGPTVRRKVGRSEPSTPEQPDDDLEGRMLDMERQAQLRAKGRSGPIASFLQRHVLRRARP